MQTPSLERKDHASSRVRSWKGASVGTRRGCVQKLGSELLAVQSSPCKSAYRKYLKALVTSRRKSFLSVRCIWRKTPRFPGPTLLPQLLHSLKSGPQVLEVWPLPGSGLAVLELLHQQWKGLVKRWLRRRGDRAGCGRWRARCAVADVMDSRSAHGGSHLGNDS